MNFNTIKQELNKKIKFMSEKDFNNFIMELKRIYYKTHKSYRQKVRINMSRSLLHDWEYDIERCCKENLPCEMKELIENIYDIAFIRGKNSKENIKSIPYIMHKKMGIPLLECQKAYGIAIEHLRSQGRLKG